MAAPVAAPKHLRLLRPFVLLAIAAGCAGTTLGFVLLERLQWRPAPFDWSWRQAHGELQVFGFLVPFITGFALFLVPRLAGGKPAEHRRIAQLALAAMGLSALFALAGPWMGGGAAVLRRPLAGAVLVGTGAAAFALHTPIAAHAQTLGSRRRAGYLWLLELALGFLAAAGAIDAVGLWRAAGRAGPLIDVRFADAAFRLAIEGFAVGMALGVSARMFTGFLGIEPSRAWPSERSAYPRTRARNVAFWCWLSAWAGSVVLGAVGELAHRPGWIHAADLLFALGAVPFALRLALWPAPKGPPIDRTKDRDFAFGARAAYALLVLGALLGAGAALAFFLGAVPSTSWSDARRHAITIGFLMTLIATMSGRLAPGYAGRAIALPLLRKLAITTFVLAALLRACEAISAQWALPRLLTASALSGPVALVAFAALFASLLGTLLRAPLAK